MKNLSSTIVLLVIGLIVLMTGCGQYNTFVGYEEDVKNAWANVETQYQRRADLIPNLVNTVKGAADFEKETLTGVIEARSNATKVEIDANNLTPEKLQEFQKAQSQVSSALSRLLVTVERYPDLKTSANFSELQAQLEGTENRITKSRMDFNKIVTNYNKTIRRFPASFFASIFGFGQKAQFEAETGADKAPEVNFN